MERRLRHQEFLAFSREVDRKIPKDLHLVLDNYATYELPEVKAYASGHTAPPSPHRSGVLLLAQPIERFFVQIATRRIGRGSSRASMR